MSKRINKTYKGCVSKRWQKRENERNKVRIIVLITFMLLARVALADTPTPAPIVQEAQSVSEDVPLPTDWTPEELKDVQSPQEAKEERIEANLYRDEVKIPVEVKIEPVKVKPRAVVKKTIVKEVKVPDTVPAGKEDIINIIKAAAAKYGVSEANMLRIAKCESGYNQNAINYNYYENGYPSGLFQHISGYWAARATKYGYEGASVFDPIANANVTAGMFRDGQSYLWECR